MNVAVRFFLILAFNFLASVSLAQNIQISGSFFSSAGNLYLITPKSPDSPSQMFRITAASVETQNSLNLLKSGDFLSGSAEIRSPTDIILYSVDFIGLQSLIGKWGIQESGEIISVINFFKILGPQSLELTYLLAPKSNRLEIILSDKVNAVVGAVKFKTDNSFVLEFDDSTKVLSFQKLK